MSNRPTPTPAAANPRRAAGKPGGRRPSRAQQAAITRRRWRLAIIAAVAVLAVGGLWAIFHDASGKAAGGPGRSGYPYSVGQPGVGVPAPGFRLAATTGGTVELSSLHGKTVLLYFQEGLS